MATDRRTYVRVHDGLPDHPKIAEVGGMAAWLYVSGLCYASRHLTDGIIPVRLVARLTDLPDPEALASRLLEANLWHPAQHDCKDCPQGIGAVYVVHDYLDHQRSAAEVRDLTAKRSAAGRNGGKASGESRRGTKNEANASASASGLLQQTRSKTEPETETETQLKEEEPSSSATATPPTDQETDSIPKPKRTRKAKTAPGPRPDVEALCNRLAELMTANECVVPEIGKGWHDAARLLLDKDKRDFDKAMALLEWCQNDEFWAANIHSMPTFRRQYDQLRQRANAQWRRERAAAADVPTAPGTAIETYTGSNVVAIRPSIPAPRPSTTDRAVASGDAALAEFRRMTGRTA